MCRVGVSVSVSCHSNVITSRRKKSTTRYSMIYLLTMKSETWLTTIENILYSWMIALWKVEQCQQNMKTSNFLSSVLCCFFSNDGSKIGRSKRILLNAYETWNTSQSRWRKQSFYWGIWRSSLCAHVNMQLCIVSFGVLTLNKLKCEFLKLFHSICAIYSKYCILSGYEHVLQWTCWMYCVKLH